MKKLVIMKVVLAMTGVVGAAPLFSEDFSVPGATTWSYVEGFHDQLEPGEFGWLSLPGKVAP